MIIMTGLSGAGKSTLAKALQEKLTIKGIECEIFDGDHYRRTVHKELGFSAADRRENISRLATLAYEKKLLGILPIIAAINPFEDQRTELADKFGAKIIWIRCDLGTLIKRDPKGLYRKALLPDGHPDKIKNLSGVNDTYDLPLHADMVIDTDNAAADVCAEQLYNYVLTTITA